MSDTQDTGITINRKPGGFLEIAPGDWMRWDKIIRVELTGVSRVSVSASTWIAVRNVGNMAAGRHWGDALFLAIERERALDLGTPVYIKPKTADDIRKEQEANRRGVPLNDKGAILVTEAPVDRSRLLWPIAR